MENADLFFSKYVVIKTKVKSAPNVIRLSDHHTQVMRRVRPGADGQEIVFSTEDIPFCPETKIREHTTGRHRLFVWKTGETPTGRPIVEGIALRERKGLKEMMARFEKTEAGVQRLLSAYEADYPLAYWWRVFNVVRPGGSWRESVVEYTIGQRVRTCWVKKEYVLSGIGETGREEWTNRWTYSPVPREDGLWFQISCEREADKVGNAVYRTETPKIVFMDREGKASEPTDPHIAEARWDHWAEDTCERWGWLVTTASVTHSDQCEGIVRPKFAGHRSSEWGRIVDLHFARDELLEQLAQAVFHPKRLERMMAKYGDDWMERV